MRSSPYSTALRILLAVLAIAGLTHWSADTRDRFEMGSHLERHSRNPFQFDPDTRQVTALKLEAEHTGIVKGATIESLNGAPYTGAAQWAAITNPATPGDTLDVGFKRPDGTTGTATITLAAEQPRFGIPTTQGEVWRQFILFGLAPLISMLIGYWVVFAKPAESNAWLLLVLLSFPEVVFSYGPGLAAGGWLVFRGLYYYIVQVIGPLALLPFAIYFPERSRVDVKVPWLKWLVLTPALIAATIDLRQLYGQFYLAGNSSRFVHFVQQTDRVENALNLACVVLYLAILLEKLRSASTEDARRRLRVLLTGTCIGVGSLLVAFVLLPDLGYSLTVPGRTWLAYAGAAIFLLAPLTLAYVVLVQRAMDVSILLRQGTRYALAKATMVGVQVVLVAVVSYRLLLPLLTQQQVPESRVWQTALFVFLIFLLRYVFRKGSTNWLDRKFFREAYDSERILSELSEEVRRFTESGPLLQTVAKCVADTLHVNQIGILLRTGPEFTLMRAVGVVSAEGGGLALAASSSSIRRLTDTKTPARLYRDDPDPWYLLAGAAERKTLDALGAELLLPLPGRNRLMGVMALGPKSSEAAYSKSDLQLLQVLATQTGMALDLSEMARSLAEEATQRERATREMEIAREVQDRLFPQQMPVLAGASVAGCCRPAQGIGGDYYDVFQLPDGRLGLAIGDVSGKGISAALLMASLRASLRGLMLDNSEDFAGLMDKVNRLVYESSASNRYATFFFGGLNLHTRELACVNAGHNAPLVLRQTPNGAHEVIRIEADGPVVGLLPDAPYSEQRLLLAPGDLLLCYTDGISETMTRHHEEWGEEGMVASAVACAQGSADEVMQTIFADADQFAAGGEQHDDMTLLVLKLDAR